jgi:NADH:ubiquinone oxidoreductase subunit E
MLKVNICSGTQCAFKGNLEILEYLQEDSIFKNKIKVVIKNCMDKACRDDKAPVVNIGDEKIFNATLDKVLKLIEEKLK